MNYTELPDNARVWIYQSNRELTDEEVTNIATAGEYFISDWKSHGQPMLGAMEIRHNRFIAIFGFDKDDNMCGRAADASVRFIKQLEEELNVGLMDRMQVAFKADGEIRSTDVNSFRTMLEQGEVGPEAEVFNNLVQTKGEFESAWETTVANSWHKSLIP